MNQEYRPSPQRPVTWLLVLTALGVVFGDIGTSPLYALREVFHGAHSIPLTEYNLFGVLSLVAWALVIVVTLKYIMFVTRADNNGEGGVLALTALACLQRRKVVGRTQWLLVRVGLFGAALLVGDGLITPAISVLSAVEGLKVVTPLFEPYVLPITVGVLVGLFSIQRRGSAKIGQLFGPIMLVWFAVLAVLGLLSLLQAPEVLKALNPLYGIRFVVEHPEISFIGLAGVFLVVTGSESLYADLGHVGRPSLIRCWNYLVLPALLLNYFGQGALLLRLPSAADNPFFRMAPSWTLIPLVVLATSAAVIASQALITGMFSMAYQCTRLNYWPRLTVIHTSSEERGQIYVPVINAFLLVGTVLVVLEFRSSTNLAGAYGTAVSLTMVLTTILAMAVARVQWRWSWFKLLLLLTPLLFIDLIFLAANASKIAAGGWFPLIVAIGVFALMLTWHRGRQLLSERLRKMSYPLQSLISDMQAKPPARIPGMAVFMVGDTQLTPPALLNNLKHNKVLHKTVVFLTVVTEEVPRVPHEERVEITNITDSIFRIVARYGFMETPNVAELLKSCKVKNANFEYDEPSYFLGREIILSTHESGMWFWRKKVFTFMARNSRSATSYFSLPTDRVVELGMQVEI